MRRIVIAVLALGLGTMAACDQVDGSQTAPAVSVSPSGVPTPEPHHTEGDDPYQEAAEKFGLPKRTIELAVIDVRVAMVARNGPAGEGSRNSAFLDAAVLRQFTERLGVPADRAETVMRFLVEEWDEYDEKAEQQYPGWRAEWAAHVAKELKITPARAAWLGTLMNNRPVLEEDRTGWDAVFAAIAQDVGVTPERLAEVVDALKSR
jgi:hypothetical protein